METSARARSGGWRYWRLASDLPWRAFARELNLLAAGLNAGTGSGCRCWPPALGHFICWPLATAASVTTAGSIGFVGLVVPHLVRLAAGNDQRLLLPASALAGGSLLVLADTAACT